MVESESRSPEQGGGRRSAMILIAFLVGHVILIIVIIRVALALSDDARARVEIGAMLLVGILFATSGLWHLLKSETQGRSLRASAPSGACAAGMLFLAAARIVSSDATGIALASCGLVLNLIGAALFVLEMRRRSA